MTVLACINIMGIIIIIIIMDIYDIPAKRMTALGMYNSTSNSKTSINQWDNPHTHTQKRNRIHGTYGKDR